MEPKKNKFIETNNRWAAARGGGRGWGNGVGAQKVQTFIDETSKSWGYSRRTTLITLCFMFESWVLRSSSEELSPQEITM